jgi:hypothetical protein
MDEPSGPAQALSIPAIASAAAGVMHATAAGIHADHPDLARLFIALAVAQVGAAVWGFVRPGRQAAWALVLVNVFAVGGWITTRLTGISWFDGLEVAERPQLADSIAAALAAVAVVGALAGLARKAPALPDRAVLNAAIIAGVLLVPGLADATDHDHGSHDDGTVTTEDGHSHATGDDHTGHVVENGAGAEGVAAGEGAAGTTDDHVDAHADAHVDDHVDDHHGTASDSSTAGVVDAADEIDDANDDAGAAWPRAWDPSGPIDFAGVPGVTPEQQARAEQLVADTLRDLPAFADVSSLAALGYQSIGDASTGFEHYINYSYFGDDKTLDPTAPESLVYQVDGDSRTLVSAMFIVARTPIDDPELVDFAGPLMQWHVHENLCWGLDENGQPKVMGVLEGPGDTCPPMTINTGGDNPMVHVWIAPHECGPFAALEGHGAGQAAAGAGGRVDLCGHGHGDDHGAPGDVTTTPYDPTKPIDLSGVPGVTPEQQAFAENLVAATVRDLPQWADPAVAEAAGFRSIGDGATGHEHYIQWDWIDDDVWLDPDHPESLVFEPQPDGSKRLVSAMFMLPGGYPLEDVPDWGGALMQWHIHGDLCFTDDPEAPQVAGVKPVGVPCRAPLVDFPLSPMIHVWITPTPCGPFAALEGIAGGQVPEGEAVLCDHAHGSS